MRCFDGRIARCAVDHRAAVNLLNAVRHPLARRSAWQQLETQNSASSTSINVFEPARASRIVLAVSGNSFAK